MAVTVDNLEIEIEGKGKSSTEDIEKMVRALESLKGFLSDLTRINLTNIQHQFMTLFDGRYAAGIDGVTHSINDLSKAIDSINTTKMNSIMSAKGFTEAYSQALESRLDGHETGKMTPPDPDYKDAPIFEFKGEGTAALEKFLEKMEEMRQKIIDSEEEFKALGGDVTSTAFQKMEYKLARVNNTIEEYSSKLQAAKAGAQLGRDILENDGGAEAPAGMSRAAGLAENLKIKLSELGGEVGSKTAAVFHALYSGSTKAAGGLAKLTGKLAGMPFKTMIGPVQKLGNAVSGLEKKMARLSLTMAIRGLIKQVSEAFRAGTKNIYKYSQAIGGNLSSNMDKMATSLLYFKNAAGAALGPVLNIAAQLISRLADAAANAANRIAELLGAFSGNKFSKAVKYATTYGEQMNGAAKSTKKAADNLQGFDEIHNLADDSGNDNGLDYSKMFEEAEVTDDVKSFADRIKEAISAGDWRGAGGFIAEKINGIIDSIDTKNAGKKLGEKFSNLIGLANGFLKEMDFEKAGNKFVGFFNGLISDTDWNGLGELVANAGASIGDFVLGIIEDFDYEGALVAFTDFCKGFWDRAAEWIGDKDWSEIAHNLYENAKKAIKNVNWGDVADSLFHLLGEAVGAGAEIVGTWVKDIITDIKNYFLRYIKDENGDGHFGAGEIINGIFEGIDAAMLKVYKFIGEHIFKPFIDGIKDAFGIHSPSKEMEPIGEYVIEGFKNGLSSAWDRCWNTIKGWFDPGKWKQLANDAWGGLTSGLEKIKNSASETWGNVKETFSGIGGNFSFSLPKFANGGFPETGQIFMANEAGPEMVGTIGGKTAVANNTDIVAAISRGVYEAMRSAGGNQPVNVNVTVPLDREILGKTAIDYHNNYVLQHGESPLYA